MPGQPQTRARRDAPIPPSGPLDWAQRARPGVLEVNGNGRAAPRQRSVLDDLDDRRRRGLEGQEIDAELEDAEDAASLRARKRRIDKLKLDLEEQRLLAILEKSVTGGGDAQIAEVIREMNATNAQQFDRMLDLLRGDARQQSNGDLAELKSLVQDLGRQVQAVATSRSSSDDPFNVNGAMALLTASENLKAKISENLPVQAPEPGMSREQVLRQIAIEEEADLRRAELKDKREDREFAREMAREAARTRRARLASAAGMVDQYAGPVLAAILGSRAQALLGGGSENGGAGVSTELGTKKAYQCPECGAVNWEEPSVEVTSCPACGISVRPFPQLHPNHDAPASHDGPLDEPHHHHDDPFA